MLGRFIDLRFFLISLALGIFIVYITQPKSTIIYVYPTPENISNIQYRDKIDNCYNFKANEVKCPDNPDDIHTIPIQTGEIEN